MFEKVRRQFIFPGSQTQGMPIGLSSQDRECLDGPINIDHDQQIFFLFDDALSYKRQPFEEASEQYWLIYFYGNGMCLNTSSFDLSYFRNLSLNTIVTE